MYESASPRSVAVKLTPLLRTLLTALLAALLRPALTSFPRSSPRFSSRFLISSAKFAREEEEIERSFMLTSNMSRLCEVIPDSITIKVHTREAMVKPNGIATHKNRPKPIL